MQTTVPDTFSPSWQSLAIVTATSGAIVVRLDAAGSSGRVVADAVALVEVGETIEPGQVASDGDVVLAAAVTGGESSGWSWLHCIPGVGAVLRWDESFDRRAAERDRLAAIIAQGNFESVEAMRQAQANALGGAAEGTLHSFELAVDAFTSAPGVVDGATSIAGVIGIGAPREFPGTQLVDITRLRPPAGGKDFVPDVELLRMGPFDWSKYTPIEVVFDKGIGTVMNGMHRIELALRAGITRLPAIVHR